MRPDLETPSVSVVLPTHNRARTLRRAIDSVLDQTYSDLEVIVVDDASEDHTKQVVEGIPDPRVRYLHHEINRGAPAARNTGIYSARGTYVAFQDSDDAWQPDKLTKQMAVVGLADHADEVVYCGMLRQEGGVDRYIPDRAVAQRDGDILRPLLFSNFVGTPTLLVPCSLLRNIGGFDETLGRFQDWDLAIRLAEIARFRLVDEPLVVAHDTPGNISSDIAAAAAAMRTLLKNHRGLYEQYPRAKAHILAGAGHLECLSGDLAGARGHFCQALRITPLAPKVWAGLLLSFLGARAYRSAHAVKSLISSPNGDAAVG